MRKARLKSNFQACAVLALGPAAFATVNTSVCMAQPAADPHATLVLRKIPAGSHWFHGEVIAMAGASITLRDPKNPVMIRTFTYSTEIRDQMPQLLDQGGFQYSDMMKLHFDTQSNVALGVKGNPSKSTL
jgi:hypothetical protein